MFGYVSFLLLGAAIALGAVTSRALLDRRADLAGVAPPSAQTEQCPDRAQFALADARLIPLGRMDPAAAWDRIREVLGQWQTQHFGDTTRKAAQAAPLLGLPLLFMEQEPAMMQQRVAAVAQNARTCFFQLRIRRVDYRIAFWFTFRPPDAQTRATALELRWLGGVKGAGERTWKPEGQWAGALVEDLVQRITPRAR